MKGNAKVALGGGFFFYFLLLLTVLGQADPSGFAICATLMWTLLILFVSYGWYVRAAGYASGVANAHLIPVVAVDVVIFIWLILRPERIFYNNVRVLSDKEAVVLGVIAALLGVFLSCKYDAFSRLKRVNSEIRKKKTANLVIPYLKYQAMFTIPGVLIALFLGTDLFSGILGLVFSGIVLAIGIGIGVYLIVGASFLYGLGVIAVSIWLTIKIFYPLFSSLSDNVTDFFSESVVVLVAIGYIIGLLIGSSRAKRKTSFV